MSNLQSLRQKVIDRNYYLSSHAEDEMLDDNLERRDLENAILRGHIEKKLRNDARDTRHRIEGPALDGRVIRVICRLNSAGSLLIVTVYALEKMR